MLLHRIVRSSIQQNVESKNPSKPLKQRKNGWNIQFTFIRIPSFSLRRFDKFIAGGCLCWNHFGLENIMRLGVRCVCVSPYWPNKIVWDAMCARANQNRFLLVSFTLWKPNAETHHHSPVLVSSHKYRNVWNYEMLKTVTQFIFRSLSLSLTVLHNTPSPLISVKSKRCVANRTQPHILELRVAQYVLNLFHFWAILCHLKLDFSHFYSFLMGWDEFAWVRSVCMTCVFVWVCLHVRVRLMSRVVIRF